MIQYRTEQAYGSHHRKAIDVMCYEIFTLGNTDILDYFFDHHLQNNPKLADMCYHYADELANNGFIDDLPKSEQLNFCQKLLDELNNKTQQNITYCLWLADKNNVLTYYADKDTPEIDAYYTSTTILSQLGSDGTLYGYEQLPQKITDNNLQS